MNKVTWKDELIRGLKHFGGEAHRQELFEYIKNTTMKEITKEFSATLQKELERLSESSKNFSGTNVFYSVEGIGSGIWGLKDYVVEKKDMDETQDDISYPEGKEKFKLHIQKERNTRLIRDAKKRFKEKNGRLFCEICGIDFYETYGEIGKDFIEAHHNKQKISDMDGECVTKIEDLLMLCPNCHSMVHRLGKYNLEISQLKNILNKNS